MIQRLNGKGLKAGPFEESKSGSHGVGPEVTGTVALARGRERARAHRKQRSLRTLGLPASLGSRQLPRLYCSCTNWYRTVCTLQLHLFLSPASPCPLLSRSLRLSPFVAPPPTPSTPRALDGERERCTRGVQLRPMHFDALRMSLPRGEKLRYLPRIQFNDISFQARVTGAGCCWLLLLGRLYEKDCSEPARFKFLRSLVAGID